MRSMVFQAARAGTVAALAAVALAACGEDTASTDDETTAAEDPLAAFTACLAEEGVELPEDWTPLGGMPDELLTGELPIGGQMPTGDMSSGAPGPDAMAAPDGVDADDWTAATAACAEQLPQGGGMPGGTSPGEQEATTEEGTDT
jgi:hypothetical protein